MTDLKGLISRVKAATGPDREIDHAIRREVCGAPAVVDLAYLRMGGNADSTPRYTASIDVIVALIERKLPGFVIYSFGNGDLDLRYSDIRSFTGWRCGLAPLGFSIKENPRDILQWPSVHASTAPLALCLAFLLALQSLDTGGGEA